MAKIGWDHYRVKDEGNIFTLRISLMTIRLKKTLRIKADMTDVSLIK